MDIPLNRASGVPIRDQLVTHLELRILDGTLKPGQRLPSVRALARRLKVHPNTVSAAYQDMEAAGNVKLQRGSGVFVRDAGSWAPEDARGLDEMIRLALHLALRKGFGAAEIRRAVERWLAAAPPDRIVVVDAVPEMAALLAHELKQRLGVRASTCSLEELKREPERLAGALALALPFYVQALRRIAPGAGLRVLHMQLSAEDRQAILALPAGSIVLVVASSPALLPFAQVVFKGMRGDEILLETRLLSDAREWKRLVRAADLVIVDALSAAAVRRASPRKLREVRMIPDATLARLKDALEFITPRSS
jgi:DNA-binding transcriptional regulator YhcF (GntR family)